MSVQPTNISNQSNYNNPFVNAICEFHDYFITFPSDLSFDKKVLEVMKKVVLAVVAPFVYLGLALMSLVTYPIFGWGVKEISSRNQETPVQGNEGGHNPIIVPDNNNQRDVSIKSATVPQILATTLESLKKAIVDKNITSFQKVDIELKINETVFAAKMDKKDDGDYQVDDLLALETVGRPLVEEIVATIEEDSDNLSIFWKFILLDKDSQHTFSFKFLKMPGFLMTNGALFGTPGYEYKNMNSPLPDDFHI